MPPASRSPAPSAPPAAGGRTARAHLADIRLLKLAEMYEVAYEQFLREVAERVLGPGDDVLRQRLRELAPEDDPHRQRIVGQLDRLNAKLGPGDHAEIVRAALEDVCDVERAAHDFYTAHLDEIRDPEVARLFRDLAREEAQHMRIAQAALQLADERAGRTRRTAAGEGGGATRIFTVNEQPLLREGVGDLRRAERRGSWLPEGDEPPRKAGDGKPREPKDE